MPTLHSTIIILSTVQSATHQNKRISVQNLCAPHRSVYLVVSHTLELLQGILNNVNVFNFYVFAVKEAGCSATYLTTNKCNTVALRRSMVMIFIYSYSVILLVHLVFVR